MYHVTLIQGGLSALMLCCESGNCELAEVLLTSLADPDLQQPVSHNRHDVALRYNYSVCVTAHLLARCAVRKLVDSTGRLSHQAVFHTLDTQLQDTQAFIHTGFYTNTGTWKT